MRTLIIKNPDTASGNFPRRGFHSLEFVKRGNGSGALVLNMRSSPGTTVTIKGGVFAQPGGDVTSVTLPNSTFAFTVLNVKVTDDNAYVYMPHGTSWGFYQNWDNYTLPNVPRLRYSSTDLFGMNTMQQMFWNAFENNEDISCYNTTNVATMDSLFRNDYLFNRRIDSLDVRNVIGMNHMFNGATAFMQDLSTLNYNLEVSWANFMVNKSNYPPLLLDKFYKMLATRDWTGRAAPKVANMGTNKYTSAGSADRAAAIAAGWTITDGGQV